MPSVSPAPGIRFTVQARAVDAHLFDVCLEIRQPAAGQVLSLPVWIPGSYLVREFAKNLQGLQAQQNGQPVHVEQLGKNQWKIACSPDSSCTVSYQVCAYDTSVRTAWLDRQRGFFNGTSLFLRVHGQEDLPHALQLQPSPATQDWHIATGLSATDIDAQGFGLYTAADYDELVDCPVEMGHFWRGQFTAGGVPHEFIVAGAAPSFDAERLLADTQKICEAQIAFWHQGASLPPMERYVFLLNVVDDNYGGLEHRNSTALICGRRDLPRQGEAKATEGYNTLLGLISHEYFHTWNVKRLRPSEFARYDYEQENYTELLWFFEGFTSYYDDLLLRRAGLIDNAQYLKLITRTINQVLQTPGRQVQSVAQASFDAWVKYYRQDENTPNHTVSYYTKGSLVALCLDLALRAAGAHSLDDVMRALWQHSQGGPIREADVLAAISHLGHAQIAEQLHAWVHSTEDLPLAELLGQHGIQAKSEPAQLAQRLGLRVQENHGVQIKMVLRGGPAEQAGMMAGDEWLALQVQGRCWRIHKLDDVLLYAGKATEVTAWVARDRQMLQLRLALQPQADAPISNLGLEITDTAAAQRWLGGQAA